MLIGVGTSGPQDLSASLRDPLRANCEASVLTNSRKKAEDDEARVEDRVKT